MKKPTKILWMDCETTGTDPIKNDIWQFAHLIEIDGEIVDGENMYIRPHNINNIEDQALEIGGTTITKLLEIETTVAQAVASIKRKWALYINKYDKKDKFVMAGYWIHFDNSFLRQMFAKAGDDKYGIGSWCFSPCIDVASFVAIAVAKHGFRFPNYKLETVCDRLGIPIDAHDALSDVHATRTLYTALGGLR